MALVVYGDSKSGNCLKVRWVAEHLGVPFEWIETDILRGRTRTAEFLALNPVGQVPLAILGGGRPLAQSNAIILHLAEGSDLIPADPYERARMLEWLFWEQYSHEPYVAVVRFQMAYLGKARESVEARLIERGEAALARLETQLKQTAFLVGGQLTLADVALVAYTRVAHEGGFDLSSYPAVEAWVGRVDAALGLA